LRGGSTSPNVLAECEQVIVVEVLAGNDQDGVGVDGRSDRRSFS
jgi:hypothetical protein